MLPTNDNLTVSSVEIQQATAREIFGVSSKNAAPVVCAHLLHNGSRI
jgi:hypothetical protein